MPDAEAVTAAVARNVRRLRQERSWTLDAFASRAGVSKGMLISIEQTRTNPSLGTLCRLSDALGVSIARLVELDELPVVRVVSADQAAVLWRAEGSAARLLVGSDRSSHLELWDWVIAPGQSHESEPHPPGSQELVHVLEGTLTLDVDGQVHRVAAGGAALFEASRPHGYRNADTLTLHFSLTVAQPDVEVDAGAGESAIRS